MAIAQALGRRSPAPRRPETPNVSQSPSNKPKRCDPRSGSALFFAAAVLALALGVPGGVRSAELALPDVGDVFAPPALETSVRAGAIAEGLRSAAPGEFVTLAGDFSKGVVAFEIFGQTTATNAWRASVKPVRMNDDTAVLALPEGLPTSSVYLIWPKSAAGFGKPFAVNRTQAWWVGPQSAAPGERISVYGRNLILGSSGASVYLAGPAGKGRTLRVMGGDAFRLDVEAPDSQPGSYELWVHNGGGGDLGWSGPLRFELGDARKSLQSGGTIDVRSFGATGDGLKDDGPAIESALAAAAGVAPSTLYFPPGIYASRRALAAPSGVRWLGAGRLTSVLRLMVPLARLAKPGFVFSYGEVAGVTLERLGVEADGLIEGNDPALVALIGSRFRFRDVALSSWGGMTLRLSASDVAVEGSVITGAGSFLASSSQIFVSDVIFRMTNDAEAALTSWGGRDIAVTDSLLVNADPSRSDGNGIGRLFVAQQHFGSLRNLYFARNETRDSAPRDCAAVDCNKGEQIILEFSGVDLQRRPAEIGPASVTFSGVEPPELAGGIEVVVAGGKGLGQRRRIVAASRGKLTLDRPWDVVPDMETSRFFVTPVAERVVVTRNRFQGRVTHSDHDSNSTAVLVWGTCFDVVVADNDISHMRHGVMVAATSGSAKDSVSAPYFALVENNNIRDGNNGLYTGLTFGFDTDPGVSGGVGNVFRKNDIRSMSHIGVAFDTWDTTGGAISAALFERNTLEDVRHGIVSGLKLIWSRDVFNPTPRGGTRLLQTVLHANVVKLVAESRHGLAFRSDPFQAWIDVDGVWTDGTPASLAAATSAAGAP